MSPETRLSTEPRVGVADALEGMRSWVGGTGIALIVLGFLAISLPLMFTVAVGYVVGTLLILSGAVHGVHAFHARKWSGLALRLLLAVLYVVAGVLFFVHPILGALTLTLVLGSYLIISGFFRTLLAVHLRAMPGWGWTLLSGLLSIALGVMVLAGWPMTAAWVIGFFIGVDLLMAGISLVMLMLATRAKV